MQSMKISTDITHFLDTTRLAMAEAVLGVILLAWVYASQYLGGLQPCVLCLYQRWPWWVATGLAMSGYNALISGITGMVGLRLTWRNREGVV